MKKTVVLLVCSTAFLCKAAEQSIEHTDHNSQPEVPTTLWAPIPIVKHIIEYAVCDDPATYFGHAYKFRTINREWHRHIQTLAQNMPLENIVNLFTAHHCTQSYLFFKWATVHKAPRFVLCIYNHDIEVFYNTLENLFLQNESFLPDYNRCLQENAGRSLCPLSLDIVKGSILPFLLEQCFCDKWINKLLDIKNVELLHKAKCSTAMELLIAHGAKVNLRSLIYGTPLHAAALDNDTEKIALLIKHMANTERGNDLQNDTPLGTACRHNKKEAAQKLLELGASINPSSPSRSPLHRACYYGHADIVKLLLEKGADIEQIYSISTTPLLTVMQSMCSETHNLQENKDHFVSTATVLLKNKANPNSKDHNGNTPLHFATHIYPTATAAKCITLLLEYGAQINEPNNYEQTTPQDRINKNDILMFLLNQK